MCSYGVVFGGIASVLVALFPLEAIKRSGGTQTSWLMVMFACMIFTKLFVSGSYVYEPYFYLLMGLSVGTLRKHKKELQAGLL